MVINNKRLYLDFDEHDLVEIKRLNPENIRKILIFVTNKHGTHMSCIKELCIFDKNRGFSGKASSRIKSQLTIFPMGCMTPEQLMDKLPPMYYDYSINNTLNYTCYVCSCHEIRIVKMKDETCRECIFVHDQSTGWKEREKIYQIYDGTLNKK